MVYDPCCRDSHKGIRSGDSRESPFPLYSDTVNILFLPEVLCQCVVTDIPSEMGVQGAKLPAGAWGVPTHSSPSQAGRRPARRVMRGCQVVIRNQALILATGS